MMTTRYAICNHCSEVIMDTHTWTIKNGSIYHWVCVLKKYEDEAKRASEPDEIPEPVTPANYYPEPVKSRRLDGAEHETRSFWDRLFRRKT